MDFGNEWQEAIGQALYYAMLTKKKAGIFLIDAQITLFDRLLCIENIGVQESIAEFTSWIIISK